MKSYVRNITSETDKERILNFKLNDEQIWVYYKGNLCHVFRKNYIPKREELYDVIIEQGNYMCEVYCHSNISFVKASQEIPRFGISFKILLVNKYNG